MAARHMTTPEHTLVGIHLAFASGLQRFCGWRGVFMAAVASNVPDWDGLLMLIEMQRFEAGHRVWGHNVLAIILSSLVLGGTHYAFDWIGKIGAWAARWIPKLQVHETLQPTTRSLGTVLIFTLIAIVAQLVHLPCDMVVSGGSELTDWPIKPWWPFSDAAYVFPLIPWGDPGPTIVLMAGVIVMAKWPSTLSISSRATLIVLCMYLVGRGWSSGRL